MAISRRVVIVSLLCLGIVGSFLFLHDNVDRSVHALRTNEAEILMFSASNPEMFKKMVEDDALKNAEIENFIFSQGNSNACLKDPSATGSTKEQLQSFVEGDCAPLIVLPGLMGTKLMVEIDCDTLEEKHPEVMEACGWNTCSRWTWTGKKPDDEYVMWIPKLTSPMGFVSIKNHSCFGRLVSLRYNSTKSRIPDRYSDLEGVRITWYGDTPNTYADADGGFNA